MSINLKKQTIEQTEDLNEVFDLQYPYIKNTVKVTFGGENIPITELGDKYIQVSTKIGKGEKIEVLYKYIGNTSIEDESVFNDNDVLNKLRDLETTVERQQIVIENLLKAVDERVNKQTFNLWLTAVERSIGREILPSNIDSIQEFHSVN